jgi:hypothetical protein
MKLDFDKFPTIKNLADDVRQKALEYAATLGARGPRPTTVLGTAATLAKEWKAGRLPTRPNAAPYLVQPRQGRWVIKRSTDTDPSHTFSKKDDAVRRAQQLARAAGAACFVFGPGGTLIERYEARALAQLALVEPLPADPEPEIATETIAPFAVEAAPAVALVAEPVPELVVAEVFAPPAIEVEAAPEIVATETIEIAPEIVATETIELAAEVAEAPAAGDPIRVQKQGAKWLVILGEGQSESQPTQKKAQARAKALGKKLGRPVEA